MLFGRRKKNPIQLHDKGVMKWQYATCGYCSTGCSIEIGLDANNKPVTTRGVGDANVNQGKLCIKGITEVGIFASAGRGTEPLIRKDINDKFETSSWEDCFKQISTSFNDIQQKYGRDAVAILSTGQLFSEEFYTLGKLVRGVIGSNNYDGNTTLCMASAVSGYKRSFGSDGPPGCYDDFSHTECLIAWGSNLPEQHPIIYWRLKEALEKRKFPLIVVDPRVTMLAQFADFHLPITPGTDVVLQNALAHVILEEGLEDCAYINAHCNGFQELAELVKRFDPESASIICGIDPQTIRTVARLYAKAPAAMSIWTMGINQSTHGSDGVVGINNLNLITGNIGKPGGTSLSITGQCNAMGTREWSSCSGLPGYRLLENEEHRQEVADFWGIEPEFLPKKRGLFQTDIFPAIESGDIKALWIVATNPMTSMPDTARIRKTLAKLDLLVVQDAYRDVETTQYAHIFLPGAHWAEKEGCMTNSERRVNFTSRVAQAPGNAKPDLWIFNQLASYFERSKKIHFPDNAAEVFEEMKQLSKGRLVDISGMSHEDLIKRRGIQWPYTEQDRAKTIGHNQAKRLYTDGSFQFPDRKAKLIPLPFEDNNERPDDEYPFWLNSGRVVEHFHTRTRTGKIGNCNKYSPTPYMEMNPDAAEELGIQHMQYVQLLSRRGDAIIMVQLTQRVPRNMVFIPFHFHNCVNRLSLGLLDPYSRQPAFKQCAIRVEHVDQHEAAQLNVAMRDF